MDPIERAGDDERVRALRRVARPLGGTGDVAAIVDAIGDARLVLLGESTHGTHEFYRLRAAITLRLCAERGFGAVAVEADWPDALRVGRFVRGAAEVDGAVSALAGFTRFPRWMWRNREVLDFVATLRGHNDRVADPRRRVGFYGLDLYSLDRSMHAVVEYLDRTDPALAREARQRYDCFDGLGTDPQHYAFEHRMGLGTDCERAVTRQLHALYEEAARLLQADGAEAADDLFSAQQNARVVRNSEAYYRTMFGGRTASWNLRDTHMADTLDLLREQLARQRGGAAKVVVWAHNSHVGDARATQWDERGQLNLGQLMRERHGEDVFLLGFTTHDGSVAAASDWDEPVELKRVRPSRADSWEHLLHSVGPPLFLLTMDDAADALAGVRLGRAIGVIYRPDTERASHYMRSTLAAQFDAVVHVQTSRAVTPLDAAVAWQRAEPETFPTGI
jgi:erythromycin esterase-like protein